MVKYRKIVQRFGKTTHIVKTPQYQLQTLRAKWHINVYFPTPVLVNPMSFYLPPRPPPIYEKVVIKKTTRARSWQRRRLRPEMRPQFAKNPSRVPQVGGVEVRKIRPNPKRLYWPEVQGTYFLQKCKHFLANFLYVRFFLVRSHWRHLNPTKKRLPNPSSWQRPKGRPWRKRVSLVIPIPNRVRKDLDRQWWEPKQLWKNSPWMPYQEAKSRSSLKNSLQQPRKLLRYLPHQVLPGTYNMPQNLPKKAFFLTIHIFFFQFGVRIWFWNPSIQKEALSLGS